MEGKSEIISFVKSSPHLQYYGAIVSAVQHFLLLQQLYFTEHCWSFAYAQATTATMTVDFSQSIPRFLLNCMIYKKISVLSENGLEPFILNAKIKIFKTSVLPGHDLNNLEPVSNLNLIRSILTRPEFT